MQLDPNRLFRLFSHLGCLQISCISLFPRNGNGIIFTYKNKQVNTKDKYIHLLSSPVINKKLEHIREVRSKKSDSYLATVNSTDSSKIKKNTLKKKNDPCIVPSLSSLGKIDITNLVGIIIGVCHISWAKISLFPLTLSDWNVKILPTDFRTSQDEQNTIKLAYGVKHMLPASDLYVMETFSIRGKHLFESVNMIQLSSMLTILLNGISTDPIITQKVVFQKAFVMNKLHGLLVGSERISTRIIIEKILYNQGIQNFPDNKFFEIYSTMEISEKYLNNYENAYLEKKEDLSLALLFTLSFLDINIFKNEISLSKIQKKKNNSLKNSKDKIKYVE